MTAELIELEAPPDGWTTDDLDALPESHQRHELIDGALVVSPSPTNMHQTIAARLVVALEESCPPEYDVTQAVEIRISKRRSFIPDVLVTTAEAAARQPSKFAPHEVVIAVEVVSPTSVTIDQVTKSALYAQAGIPYYWLVDTLRGIAVHAYRLDARQGIYRPAGHFTERLKLSEPWDIDIPLSRITPRHYRPAAE
ncbi:MAG TPA: Uma2 family endonuclease [Streptosporangiaceae bacterium]|nr:Uma2 family endonuclease [Streptosporangiaceae bacterium]